MAKTSLEAESKVTSSNSPELNEKSPPDSRVVPASERRSESSEPTQKGDEPAAIAEGKGEDEDDTKYLSGLQLVLLTIGLCLVLFVVALDNTIIATAIPRITTAFDSLDDVGWYGSAYLLTTTSLQPSFGKLYTFYNVKWTYMIALVVFEIGSIICAAAVNSPMLIVGRAVAGAGAGGLFSGAMIIIAMSVPLRKRPIYLAGLSSMFGIASVVGPILGGVLTDKATWRWCFWINLPFGGTALLAVFLFFRNPGSKDIKFTWRERLKRLDALGATFLIGAVVCLLLALQWGGQQFPWNSSQVIGLIVGAGVIAIIFAIIQVKAGDDATIPLKIILNRTVWSASLFMALLAMALYTHIYYLPFYFQAVKGTTAEQSGIRTIPYLVSVTISSIFFGAAITTTGYYKPFMPFAAAVFAVGAGLISTLGPNTSTGKRIGYQIVTGVGGGAGVQIPIVAVQAVLSKEQMASGNSIAIFFNTLGGAISVAIAENVFANSLIKEVPKFTTGIDPASVAAAGATQLRQVVPADQLQGVLQAYAAALDKAYILPIAVSAAAFFVSFFVEGRNVKGQTMMPGAA